MTERKQRCWYVIVPLNARSLSGQAFFFAGGRGGNSTSYLRARLAHDHNILAGPNKTLHHPECIVFSIGSREGVPGRVGTSASGESRWANRNKTLAGSDKTRSGGNL